MYSKRPVFDGKGVTPDVKVEKQLLSDISASLITKNLFFEYATNYRIKHDSIKPVADYVFTNTDFADFVKFLDGKDYAYTTDSENLLAKLEEKTKEEKYFDDVKTEYQLLKDKLQVHKKDDLTKFKEEIITILETEIVGRYYYQNGLIENSLKRDPTLEEATKTIKNVTLFKSILAGTNK